MNNLIIPAIILFCLLPEIIKRNASWLSAFKRLFKRKEGNMFFDGYYIEVKNFYVHHNRTVPCITSVNDLSVEKAFAFIDAGYAGKVKAVYQRNFYNWQTKTQEFNKTIFLLEKKRMILLGDGYAEFYFDKSEYNWANNMVNQFLEFKAPEKEVPFEINIITCDNHGIELKPLEIKPTELDINLYYNNDFKGVDELIRKRLMLDNDKGIILLHGLPGTGKTTYLRHLIGGLKKKVLFVSPGVAGNLMNPEFIDLLIDNPNSVLVIEDAENIIMDRKFSSNSSVSNLLNISDGLLSDCLNVQIICTFNNALSMVDSALMRKGRLIAKYEFGKLSVEKAVQLSEHLGFDQVINKPMTLAEVSNPDEKEYEIPKIEVLGFRRKQEVMN